MQFTKAQRGIQFSQTEFRRSVEANFQRAKLRMLELAPLANDEEVMKFYLETRDFPT
jgi:hypothetical protein